MADKENNGLFRESALKKASVSPENLYDYIHISRPSTIIILIGCIAVFVGLVFVWGFNGRIIKSVQFTGVADGNKVVCYLTREQVSKIQPGMELTGGGEVTGICYVPVSSAELEEQLQPEVMFYLNPPEYSYPVTMTLDEEADSQIVEVGVITSQSRPIDYLFNDGR